MKIRKANSSDAMGIAIVQVDSWKTTYKGIVPDEYLAQMTYESREEKWNKILSLGGIVFVAENMQGKIVGFASCGKQRDNKYAQYRGELYAIYILEDYQRRGLGKLLVQSIIQEFTQHEIFEMIVFVLEDNASRTFYEALGGKKIDCVDTEISGKKFKELVYGWDDIRKIEME